MSWRRCYGAADAIGAHVMLHPGLRADEHLAPRNYADLGMHRASSIDLHTGIAHALLTLIHSGLPARRKWLTFQVVNLGGTFPILVERMDHIVATRDPEAPRPSTMLGGICVDNASLGPRALPLTVAVFGPDRVMLGTAYPIFSTDVATDALDGNPARRLIGRANAADLLARRPRPDCAASRPEAQAGLVDRPTQTIVPFTRSSLMAGVGIWEDVPPRCRWLSVRSTAWWNSDAQPVSTSPDLRLG